jgi:nitrous oxidase accessory protein
MKPLPISALLLLLLSSPAMARGELQSAINKADPGAVITLGEGLYEGRIEINKPLTLRAAPGVTAVIRGDGSGNVITVKSPQVTIEGLSIEASGTEHQSIDSGIAVIDGYNVKILRNTIRNCLFGINLEKTHQSIVENNDIESLWNRTLGLRGDGIRLWYSHANEILLNKTRGVRDNVFWYSSANRVEGNEASEGRYALHFMYANRNTVVRNNFHDNSVGVFLMYSQGSRLIGNRVSNAEGAFGIGIGMKESSDMTVSNNDVIYNARGFYLDTSPYQPGTTNVIKNNRLLFNTTAFQMYGTLLPSTFEGNSLVGNIQDIGNDTPESNLAMNRWFRNYWDNYEGFDRDSDGIGDIPHEEYAYADRLWGYLPASRIFYGSPVMSFLNFLAKVMPFSEPQLLARDDSPLMKEKDK